MPIRPLSQQFFSKISNTFSISVIGLYNPSFLQLPENRPEPIIQYFSIIRYHVLSILRQFKTKNI